MIAFAFGCRRISMFKWIICIVVQWQRWLFRCRCAFRGLRLLQVCPVWSAIIASMLLDVVAWMGTPIYNPVGVFVFLPYTNMRIFLPIKPGFQFYQQAELLHNLLHTTCRYMHHLFGTSRRIEAGPTRPEKKGGCGCHGSGAYQSAARLESSRWKDKISEVKFAQWFSVSASLPENLVDHILFGNANKQDVIKKD